LCQIRYESFSKRNDESMIAFSRMFNLQVENFFRADWIILLDLEECFKGSSSFFLDWR